MGPRRRRQRRPGRKACGRVWRCDDGADVACASPGGGVHTLRLRYCLDCARRVSLRGTGVVRGDLVRVLVGPRRRVSVTPARHAAFVRRCVERARPSLNASLRTYLARFSPAVHSVLDLRGVGRVTGG